jgi:ABC-type nitrate/sulfonate/bicarbonate transport system substrate-binding protein
VKKSSTILIVLLLVFTVSSFWWASGGSKEEVGKELTKVRVANIPFFDYQFIAVAKEFGWDKELGLDLEVTWLTQSGPSIQALANGSIDIVPGCVVCSFPFYESVPSLVSFLTTEQFKGFIVIGRRGKSKPYEDFLKELGDPEEAKKATIMQLVGSTMPMYSPNYMPLLKGMLEQVGLEPDVVNTINFPDDEKSAIAMLGGTGDFYMGGLPAEINLMMNHPDRFQRIGGTEILGPAGLWYSNYSSTKEWLAENEDAALRIIAMSYRYNRYVNEDPDKVLPIVVETLNAHSGVATDNEEIKFIFETFLDFRDYQREKEETYNPNSPLYWKVYADYYAERSELPPNTDIVDRNPLDEWFNKFLARKDLLKWVDRPLD